jgi:hypothetical protein
MFPNNAYLHSFKAHVAGSAAALGIIQREFRLDLLASKASRTSLCGSAFQKRDKKIVFPRADNAIHQATHRFAAAGVRQGGGRRGFNLDLDFR